MAELVPIALLAWIPICAGLFTWFQPRRALLVAYIVGFLFLPQGQLEFAGFPELTRTASTSIGVLIGIMFVDAGRVFRFRPSWVDIPMAVWCLAPLASSISNQIGEYFGIYDGLSVALGTTLEWGVPYFMARLYITRLEHLRELGIAILIGGLVYVPLCLFEVRMSPQLHHLVYGYHPTHFGMTYRWGGYRPMVFLQHGLMLGLWMTAVSITAVWLWYGRSYRALFGVPAVIVMIVVVLTTILCKSTGALALLMGALGLLFALRHLRLTTLVYVAVLIPPLYMFARANGWWDGEQMVHMAAMIDEERASSLEGRLENETLIADRAMERPLFGWGQWGRWRVTDEQGKDITVADGMWIITLGQAGLVGLGAMMASLLLPILLLVRTMPVRLWSTPAVAPAAALAAILLVYVLDLLLNAMISPVYVLIAGGLSSLYVAAPGWRARLAHMRRTRRGRVGRAGIVTRPTRNPSRRRPGQHEYA